MILRILYLDWIVPFGGSCVLMRSVSTYRYLQLRGWSVPSRIVTARCLGCGFVWVKNNQGLHQLRGTPIQREREQVEAIDIDTAGNELEKRCTEVLTCRENSYSEGNSCATAPTASSATFMQSASERDTIRGVRQAQSPASVISLHPASSSSNSDCK